jgi:hypothetical protein
MHRDAVERLERISEQAEAEVNAGDDVSCIVEESEECSEHGTPASRTITGRY